MTAPNNFLYLSDSWFKLEQLLLKEIEQEKAEDVLKPVVVLVGSRLLARNLELTIYPALNRKGIGINVRFLLFPDLVKKLELTPPFPEFKKTAGTFLKWLLTQDLLKKLEPFHYFSPIKDLKGMVECLINEHRDLKDGLIIGKELEQVKKALSQEKKSFKLKALFEILEKLDERLQNYEEDWEKFKRAIERTNQFKEVFQTEHLLVYGFYDFTALQKLLLQSLSQHIRISAFMLKPEKNFWFFEYAERVFRFYQKDLRLFPKFEKGNFLDKDLSRWKKVLSCGERMSLKSDLSFQLILAPGIDREVREICREIMRLVKQEGLKFNEIGILIRDYSAYAYSLQEMFSLYQIPYFLGEGKPLKGFSIIRTLICLLRIPQENYSRRTLLAFLSSQYLRKNLIPDPEISFTGLFDLVSREALIVNGREEWEEKLNKYLNSLQTALQRIQKKEVFEEEDEDGIQKRKELIEKKIQASEKLRIITRELFSQLERLRLKTDWKSLSIEVQELAEKYLDFDSEAKLKEELEKIFQEIGELDQTGIPADYDTFLRLVEAGVNKNIIEYGKFREEGVCISELMKVRGVRFKALFLPGLCEGSFPFQISENSLLSDEDRSWVNKLCEKSGGLGYLAEKQRQPLEERLLFFLACQQADEFLILSAPWVALETDTEKPISYILYYALEQILPEPVEIEQIRLWAKNNPNHRWIRALSLSDFFAKEEEYALSPDDWEYSEIEKQIDTNKIDTLSYLHKDPAIIQFCQLAKERLLNQNLGFFSGYLGKDEFYQKNFSCILPSDYSPNRLRSYFTCPFQYLVNRVLELNVLTEPVRKWELERYERGNLLHLLLHLVFSQLKTPNELQDTNKFSQVLMQVISQEGRKYLEEILTPEMIVELELAETERLLNYWREDILPGPEIKKWETEFWIKEESAELELDDGAKVYLRGKIDRLARGDDMLEITDYKFGSLDDLKKNPLKQFQLPLYLLAVLNVASGISPEKIISRFLVMDTKKWQKPEVLGVSGIMLKELKEKLGLWIKKMREGIEQGVFIPLPDGKKENGNCGYCNYSSICFGLERPLGVQEQDSFLQRFLGFLQNKEQNAFPIERIREKENGRMAKTK